jgi:hypothetical protein
MPKMYTNNQGKPVEPVVGTPADSCVKTHDEFKAQRVLNSNVTFDSIQQITEQFKTEVILPLRASKPDLEMGEYFVVPVDEIRNMLAACANAEFIHISNAIRTTKNRAGEDKKFPVAILAPILKMVQGGNLTYDVFKDTSAMYIEAYPCPPDPNCPNLALIGTILKSGTKTNNFNSLF